VSVGVARARATDAVALMTTPRRILDVIESPLWGSGDQLGAGVSLSLSGGGTQEPRGRICLLLSSCIQAEPSTPAQRQISMANMIRLPPSSGALLGLAMLVFMSACGAQGAAVGAASSSSPLVSADQQPGAATKPTPAPRTLSGVIIEGIRSNCRVLQTDQRRYALTGEGTQRLQQGQEVTVTGVERSDLINPCGLTFLVASIRTGTAPSSAEIIPRNGSLPTD
jgi:hypothetical protein